MNQEMIRKAEDFLKTSFAESLWAKEEPAQMGYRLEHSYRVANIARTIAAREGMNETLAVLGGLLHDIAYCEGITSREEWKNHGRRSAAMARPFLQELGLTEREVNEVCYAIAIHVDDEADFSWQRSAFSETVGDADNIDRFDAYRIYETLEYQKFSSLSLTEKREKTESMLAQLKNLRSMKLGTSSTMELWKSRMDDYIAFYEKLREQLEASDRIQ